MIRSWIAGKNPIRFDDDASEARRNARYGHGRLGRRAETRHIIVKYERTYNDLGERCKHWMGMAQRKAPE